MKVFKFLLVFFILLTTLVNIKAADEEYQLVAFENGKEVVLNKSSYLDDIDYDYDKKIDEYSNLAIKKGGKYLKTKYGVVQFNVNEGCTYNTEYINIENQEEGYLNGCYGIDGAYIETDSRFRNVTFKVSGVIARVSIDKVKIIPFDILNLRPTTYTVIDGILFHQIKTQLSSDYVTSMINLAKAPDYLKEKGLYYSYDGHYFYDDFKKMIDDYVANENKNALNSKKPYYNYFLYLPHRSVTNYNFKDVEDYFLNNLKIESKLNYYDDLDRDYSSDIINRSQYFGDIESFFQNQYIYGANALMMLGLSINESATGRSRLAYNRNNLFGHAAYDSDVEKNASRYSSVANSIYSHAKYYISSSYANPLKSLYHGSFFGDKQSGMNVAYASDPYWGEKAAYFYYLLDKELGQKDLNNYALGIAFEKEDFAVYDSEKLEKEIYKLKHIKNYSVIILEEKKQSYKIQLEPSLYSDFHYDFGASFGYVKKSDLNLIINKEKIGEKKFYKVNFDADGGQFEGNEKLSFDILENDIPSIKAPIKKGYEFLEFEPKLMPIKENSSFKAKYIKIKEVKLTNNIKEIVELDHYLNLKDVKLAITYEDGEYVEKSINTDMISNFDIQKPGKQEIVINYCGFELKSSIYVDEQLDKDRLELEKIRKQYLENDKKDKEILLKIKQYSNNVQSYYNFDDLRKIDEDLMNYVGGKINYHIIDNRFDLSISGMGLAFDVEPKINNPFFKDTFVVEVNEVAEKQYNKMSDVLKGFGFEIADSLRVTFSHNYDPISPKSPFILNVKPKDIKNDVIYSVYALSDDGDIVKLKTTRTKNYVQFMSRNAGNFIIAYKKTTNNYDISDNYENLNINNNGINYHHRFITIAFVLMIVLIFLIFIVSIILFKRKKVKDHGKNTKSNC